MLWPRCFCTTARLGIKFNRGENFLAIYISGAQVPGCGAASTTSFDRQDRRAAFGAAACAFSSREKFQVPSTSLVASRARISIRVTAINDHLLLDLHSRRRLLRDYEPRDDPGRDTEQKQPRPFQWV